MYLKTRFSKLVFSLALFAIGGSVGGLMLRNLPPRVVRSSVASPDSATNDRESQQGLVATAVDASAPIDKIASPDLTPKSVVQLQVEATRAALTQPDRLRVCFELASPSNRAVTGPIARFAEMVFQPPYRELATAEFWQAGEAKVDGDTAQVLVTTCNLNGLCTGYRFWLRLQSDEPFRDCWMTDMVEPLSLVDFRGEPIRAVSAERTLPGR
jgi:hypothetical protein